jgi:diguanylate cyclase (GGDEF)-like protein/PAS domain S-box-containing protein
VADPSGNITEIAPLWGELVGLSREASYGQGWADVVHPDDIPEVNKKWTAALAAGDGTDADVRYRVKLVDGSYRWFRARARPRYDDQGRVIAWYGSLEDIHDQVLGEDALRASEERYRLASRATNDVIWDWSVEEREATWAGAYKKVLGYGDLSDGTDLNWWLDRIHPDDRPRVIESQEEALNRGAEYWHEEYRFLVASGEWIEVKSRCVIVRNDEGEPTRLVGTMLDVTQQKKAEAELHWSANHDPLTRLPNRTLYKRRKREAIAAARESGQHVALIVLDLNNFKEMNDTLGHAAGDKVLEDVAGMLLKGLPKNATIARLGGDEFAIILPGLREPSDYEPAITKLAETLSEPIRLRDTVVTVKYSAGVAIWPRDSEDPAELLIAADLALYAAKEQMPGSVVEFTSDLKSASEQRAHMLSLAQQALDEDRIIPFYQPKVDLKTGKLVGWEALLRLQDENGRILPPSAISAALSDSEVAVQLTDRMLSKVFFDLDTWKRHDIEPGRIAVNLSPADFRQAALIDRIKFHADAADQPPSAIDVEVTETVLIGDNRSDVPEVLQNLRDMGIQVALDDFGTGFASLTHLQEIPLDIIKIDKTFIDKIDPNDPMSTAVTDAVIDMARRLVKQTVAEGIETKEQAEYLRNRGCDVGQGYLFDKPLPSNEVPLKVAELADGARRPSDTMASAEAVFRSL